MNLSLLTCTSDRPEAFALCEKYVARQTVQPFQWIVMDDGNTPIVPTLGQEYYFLPDLHGTVSMVGKVRYALASNLIKGDALVFWEDDDWYAPNYLEWLDHELKAHELVGEGRAVYYNVACRAWFTHGNRGHASLCSTAMRMSLMPTLVRVLATLSDQYIDSPLWRDTPEEKKKVFDPEVEGKRLVVGIKGMPGRVGVGGGHGQRDPHWTDDATLYKLRELIGGDAMSYAPFARAQNPYSVSEPGFPTWLANLRGKPNVLGIELGAVNSETSSLLTRTIFTGSGASFKPVDDPAIFDIPLDVALIHANSEDAMAKSPVAFEKLRPFGGKMILQGYHWHDKPPGGLSPHDAIEKFLNDYAGRYFMIAREDNVVLLKQ